MSRRKARWFIRRCLWTRNFSASASCGAEPSRAAACSAILSPTSRWSSEKPLAQVVDQQGQVQHVLVGDAAVDASHRARLAEQLGGELHRPEAVLVDRVLVVLVELEQSAGVGELGDEPLQDARLVQVAQQRARAGPGCAKQREEMAAGLGRRQLRRAAGPPRGGSPPRWPGAIGTSCRLARSTSRRIAVRLPRSRAQPAPRGHHARRARRAVVLERGGRRARSATSPQPLARGGLGHEPRTTWLTWLVWRK